MSSKKRKRSAGKIDKLPAPIKDNVEQMILTGVTYREIVEYLKQNEVTLSPMSVCNYARKFLANMQMLTIAQENFRMMMQELDKYPSLDSTEGLIRIISNNLFNAINNAPSEAWDNIEIKDLLRETSSLVKATAYKHRIDVKNNDDFDNGLERIRQFYFDAMARERPDLYKQFLNFTKEIQERDIKTNDY